MAHPHAPSAPAPRTRERPAGPDLARVFRVLEVVLALAAVGFVGHLFVPGLRETFGGAPAADVRLDPVRVVPPPRVIRVLGSREITLDAGEHFETAFRVDDPRPCTLTGRVTGVAGGGRDVDVFVLDQASYQAWYEGRRPRAVFYNGRAAETRLDVRLPARGRYHLLVSNRFSLFTGKRVEVGTTRVTCKSPAR